MPSLLCPNCEDDLIADSARGESSLLCPTCDWEGSAEEADAESDEFDPEDEDIILDECDDEYSDDDEEYFD